ncbi:MAG: DUF5305 domain-containing protein [Tenericutes bacterium]|nr:DUF5305 domain-containing protein [Mycoplasmatota bacterium]
MENSKKRTNKKIINNLKLLFLVLIILLISLYIYSNNKKVAFFSYNENSQVDYLVYLKENDYYETNFLPKGMQYIASAIDYMDVTFNYNFKTNDDFNYNYNYYINANVKVFEKGNESNIIYEKTEKLLTPIIIKDKKNNEFNIKENIKIDYGKYNSLVRSFKTDYNIIADSNITLTLFVNIDGKYEEFEDKIINNSKTNIVIPLSEQTLNIKVINNDIKNNEIVKKTETKSIIGSVLYNLSIFLSVVSLIVVLNIIITIIKESSRKTVYQKKIDKLLREYDRVIVEVKSSIIKSDDTNFIMVKTFEELLDVSDRLEQPILHYENDEEVRSQFIVRDDKDTYFYVVDSKNMDK